MATFIVANMRLKVVIFRGDVQKVGDALAMDIMSDMPDDPKCERFANYMYMVDTCGTTNGAESYHSHLNQQFYTHHPNIFVLLDTLVKLQNETYVKIRGMSVDFAKTD